MTLPKYSYSQLMTWDRCHYSWYLNYHEGWSPIETKSYFVEGSVGHDLLMVYYKNLPLTDHDSCVKLVKQKVGQYHSAAGDDVDKLKIVTTIARVVKQYLEEFAVIEDQKWDFLDAEKKFEIPLVTPQGRDYILEGVIDILAREKATSRIWLWDHKFVGRGRFWSEEALLMDSQTPTYIAGLQQMNVPIFGAIMNQLNKHEYSKPQDRVPENLFKRKPIYHTNSELETRLIECGKMVDEVEECKESGNFRRSLKHDCEMCFWQDPCLLLLKTPGSKVEDVMNMGAFTKKAEKKALI
jgi:hypothetical protein